VFLGKPPSEKPKQQTWYKHQTTHSGIYIIEKYTVYSGTKLKKAEKDANEGSITKLPVWLEISTKEIEKQKKKLGKRSKGLFQIL